MGEKGGSDCTNLLVQAQVRMNFFSTGKGFLLNV